MTEALQKVTREVKAMSADKYDITAQGETRGGFELKTLRTWIQSADTTA